LQVFGLVSAKGLLVWRTYLLLEVPHRGNALRLDCRETTQNTLNTVHCTLYTTDYTGVNHFL